MARKFSWIRKKRLARGLSQAELAALVEVSQPRVSSWERGLNQGFIESKSGYKSATSDAQKQLEGLIRKLRLRSGLCVEYSAIKRTKKHTEYVVASIG